MVKLAGIDAVIRAQVFFFQTRVGTSDTQSGVSNVVRVLLPSAAPGGGRPVARSPSLPLLPQLDFPRRDTRALRRCSGADNPHFEV